MLRSLLPASLTSLLLVAAAWPEDTYDLVPRFADGMQLDYPLTGKFNAELDDVTAEMGGQDILGGAVAGDIQVEIEGNVQEEILETKDGAVVKMRRSFLGLEWSAQGEAEAAGESQSLDESGENDLVGRVLEITIDEDGEATVVDVTEGDLEALDAEELEAQGKVNTFESLLPSEPVEVGGTWNPVGMLETISEDMLKEAEAEGDAEVFQQFMDALHEYGSAEATGTLVSVEDDVAEISWEINLSLDIGDLLSFAQLFDESGDLEDIPPGAMATMYMGLAIEGSGKFDLVHHQLTSLELSGDFEFEAGGEMDSDQISISANASASGELSLTTGATIL